MQHLQLWVIHFILVTAVSHLLQVIQFPKFLSLHAGDTAIISCSLSGCAAKRYSWNKTPEFENGTKGSHEDLFNNSRVFTYVSGTVKIENVTISDNGVYYCTAIQVCNRTRPLVVEKKGTRLQVSATPTLQLQSNLSSNDPELLILTCSVVGFYPSNITLCWHHFLPGVPYITQQGAPSLLYNGTYRTYSTLMINTKLWIPGTEIWCEANHMSLDRPLKKYIKRPFEKTLSTLKYEYLFAVLPLPVILGCVYLMVNFFRTSTALEAAKSTDEGKSETEEDGLQYSTLLHKSQKNCSSSKNENDIKCIYTEMKPKQSKTAECEESLDYAILDMRETPDLATVNSMEYSQYSSLA